MQMCQDHWDMLREEIDNQGMGHMVAANAEIMEAKMLTEMATNEDTKFNFDPLMRAHTMIMTRTFERAGLLALAPAFGCPICFFNSKRTDDGQCACEDPDCGGKIVGIIPPFEDWLKGPNSCVTSIREYAERKGLLDA